MVLSTFLSFFYFLFSDSRTLHIQNYAITAIVFLQIFLSYCLHITEAQEKSAKYLTIFTLSLFTEKQIDRNLKKIALFYPKRVEFNRIFSYFFYYEFIPQFLPKNVLWYVVILMQEFRIATGPAKSFVPNVKV